MSSPFCEHVAKGGAYDLAKDLRLVVTRVLIEELSKHMNERRARRIALDMEHDMMTAICVHLATGYME